MKKILLLLLVLYNYSFAVYTWTNDCSIASNSNFYQAHYKNGYWTSTDIDFYGWETDESHHVLLQYGVCVIEGRSYAREFVYSGPTCEYGLNGTTLECNPPTCTETDSTNTDCTCKTNFIEVDGECTIDCQHYTPIQDVVPNGWVSYVDTYTSDALCLARASQFYYNEYEFKLLTPDTSYPECTHAICNVNEYTADPCASSDAIVIPKDYIFKGTTDTELQCSQFVDGVTYYDYNIQRANADCPSNDFYYCYLAPINTDNVQSAVTPDENTSYPDGTIPLDSVPAMDLNTSGVATSTLDSINRSNVELGTISKTLKDLHQTLQSKNFNPEINVNPDIDITIEPTTLVNAINAQTTEFQGMFETLNGTLGDMNNTVDLTETNDLLRQEVNASNLQNELLQNDINITTDMSSKLDLDTDKTSVLDDVDVSTFASNLESDYNLISGNFETLKDTIQNGFDYSTPTGTYVASTATIKDKTITFDLCGPMSSFSPIIQFLITVTGFLLTLKIYFRGLL